MDGFVWTDGWVRFWSREFFEDGLGKERVSSLSFPFPLPRGEKVMSEGYS